MKNILVLVAALFLSGCIVVPVVPNSVGYGTVGVDVQPNVVYNNYPRDIDPIIIIGIDRIIRQDPITVVVLITDPDHNPDIIGRILCLFTTCLLKNGECFLSTIMLKIGVKMLRLVINIF